ncbi:MAG: hypothetical protein AEth_01086 [Candidatus Argoarchaeum ethanivorans]|uniref:CRISPR type III-associated protein domain-containing protein n=1 Tax=Candidatus Argoarchaeum ethanivorans TaxID=2608793 RepID=A0A8B3S293_9EURY|nr:MAG: hypothetical protein AEth_01086 [Candidatus Argoarchaeum ethanivorans]
MVFEKLETITEIEVQYTTRSCLVIHVGKSAGYSIVDQPIIKIGGVPVIPGSSIKGALRSTTESIMSESGIDVCIPEASIPKTVKQRGRKDDYAKELKRLPPCDYSRGNVCPACDLFGAASLSGRAMFLDARPESEIVPIKRTHVAIRRDTNAQSEGSLMELEAVDEGAVFLGTIRIVNAENWQIGAILRSLEVLKLMGLGAKKTAGYGEIDTQVKKITQNTFENGERAPEDKTLHTEDYMKAFEEKLSKHES